MSVSFTYQLKHISEIILWLSWCSGILLYYLYLNHVLVTGAYLYWFMTDWLHKKHDRGLRIDISWIMNIFGTANWKIKIYLRQERIQVIRSYARGSKFLSVSAVDIIQICFTALLSLMLKKKVQYSVENFLSHVC